VTPGAHVSFAGTDIAAGEIVLHRGQQLSSRETGVLAAIGIDHVPVYRQPRVGVLSTGDEIIPPGQETAPAMVYDSNARIIADAVREAGGVPVELGIVPDDEPSLRSALQDAISRCDVVLLSGGTSKGAGDISYRVLRELKDPGIVAHGVALKPGKPICLAATMGKPVVILPGFPTSAIFTFHEFVAPVIRRLARLSPAERNTLTAKMAVKINSEIGRTEYVLVSLVRTAAEGPTSESTAKYSAFPLGKGSGSVTTFSRADGFVTIDRHEELVEADTMVEVQLLGRDLQLPDLVVIGSHCVGLDMLLSRLRNHGWRDKFIAVGSTAGLEAVRRQECDIAGIHLLDPDTGQYNRPFLTPELELISGYGRLQGVVFRLGDIRFEGQRADNAIAKLQKDPACLMVNRNQGSGTRILIDQLLKGAKPPGYAVQSRSHNAVAAAVKQGRADWGVAIDTVARQSGLGFLPLREERFDFVVHRARRSQPAVEAFVEMLADVETREQLARLGFVL
jgi:putative molybdopterin biosynthesis protein